LLGAVCSLFAEKISFILEVVVLEIFTIAFLVEYFIYNSYRVFMSKTDIATGAGDVVTGFGGVVVGLILRGIPIILLFHVPLALMIWRRKDLGFRKPMNFRPAGVQALAGVVLLILGALFAGIGGREGNFSSDVQTKGLIYATGKDLRGGYELDMEAALDAPDVLSAAHGTGSSSGPSFFGLNKLNVDLDALIASSSGNIKAAHQYVQQQKPSPKNEYTGLFAGKNLIFITAEAFSEELISEELTPALYRMATKGINFNDYYQPAWGGSTSTGEYSNMMGIVPMDGVNSIQDTIGKDNSINIFHKLRSLGYFSECYHNGLYDYYGRNRTHTGLGFDNFIAKGNGMEDYLLDVWPDSDLEMMKYTMTRYMDHQPFSVYYMSISGHTNYAWSANAMSKKNRDAVAELPYSEQVKGYFACNLELEYALEYVIQTLEEAGIANDTVIVLGTDHYPYGLEKSAAWGTDKDYLQELYGYAYQTPKERDHSRLLIWSGCLEESDPIQIDFPTYSLDIQPTLCNLFGVEYDSRLFVGQDVFSEDNY
ncbi:MAG: LTA synthase family protein, partial [Firmicutes bacterium]|nr:LTA synthase family protein [Bacillota bacterium]